MRTDAAVRRLKASAEEFGVKPELAWLMENGPLWDDLRRQVIDRNKTGKSIGHLPIDQLRGGLLVLAAIIGESNEA